MNDPWAGPVAEPPKITAHQVGQIITLIEDYTPSQAQDLIDTLSGERIPGQCVACRQVGRHTSTCPTQGDRS